MNRAVFGKKLQNKRKIGLKKSLADMESMTDISSSYLHLIEKGGIVEPKLDMLRKIAKGYKIPLKEVMSAFHESKEDAERAVKMDAIIKEIMADEKLDLGQLTSDALKEDMGENTKLLLIRLYEKIHKKTLLVE